MYELQFSATDDADWAVMMPLINDSTNQPLDTTDVRFDLSVKSCGHQVLTATTDDDSIQVPELGTIQWRFTAEQMKALQPRQTYVVGCNMTNAAGTTPLFVGTLAVIDGGF
jgi:hypothetical protein